jgi:hypothetical protein
MEDL